MRSLRGLALSPDDSSVYGGFIQKSQGSSVQHFTLAGDPVIGTLAGSFNVTTIGPSGADHQPKAVATDDRGIVFIGSSKDSTSGDNARIIIKGAALDAPQTVVALADVSFPGVTGERAGGVSVQRIGGTLYLYVSREHPGSAWVERYVVGGAGAADATLTLDTSFNGTGRFSIRTVHATASDLRGLEVDAAGNIFVASRADNAVYRISADLATVDKTTVSRAMDLALFDQRVFVTSYDGADSSIFELSDLTLQFISEFDAFDAFPRIGADGDVADTGYSGIDISSDGRIFLADQFYLRNAAEARDRLLVSSPLAFLPVQGLPEPTGLAALALGLLLWSRFASRAGTQPVMRTTMRPRT